MNSNETSQEKNNDSKSGMSQTKARLVVGLMFALFVIPNIYVLYIYKTGEVPMGNTTEKGIFLKPFIETKGLELIDLEGSSWQTQNIAGQFALINFVASNCKDQCLDRLFNTQQILKTLTRYKGRVDQITVIVDEQAVTEDLQTVIGLKEEMHTVKNGIVLSELLLPHIKDTSSLENFLMIMDPDGKILMYYPPQQNINEALRDLKRLLKVSMGKNSFNEQSKN